MTKSKKPEAARSQTRESKPTNGANQTEAARRRPTSKATKVASQKSGTSAPKEPDAGTKQSRILSMLRSPAGATIAVMMAATGWQQHSVRGFLAGVVRKRLKLTLTSDKVDGARVYRITGGDGTTHSGQPKRRAA